MGQDAYPYLSTAALAIRVSTPSLARLGRPISLRLRILRECQPPPARSPVVLLRCQAPNVVAIPPGRSTCGKFEMVMEPWRGAGVMIQRMLAAAA